MFSLIHDGHKNNLVYGSNTLGSITTIVRAIAPLGQMQNELFKVIY